MISRWGFEEKGVPNGNEGVLRVWRTGGQTLFAALLDIVIVFGWDLHAVILEKNHSSIVSFHLILFLPSPSTKPLHHPSLSFFSFSSFPP